MSGGKYYDPVRAIVNMDSASNATMIIKRSVLESVIPKTNNACKVLSIFAVLGDHEKRVDKLAKLKGVDIAKLAAQSLKI